MGNAPTTTLLNTAATGPTGLPDGVELRHLVAVHTVAVTGSFGRAAEQLGYTQSAISQQVATAEKRLGMKLFDRPGGPKAVVPTAAGTLVAERVANTLAGLGALADDLASLASGQGGRVTLGTFQSISVRILPALVTLARREMPHVEIRIVESHLYRELEERLAAGELDLTFSLDGGSRLTGVANDGSEARNGSEAGGLEWVELGDDGYVVLAPLGAGLGDEVDPSRLAGRPLVGEDEGNSCQVMVAQRLAAVGAGASLDYVFRSSDNGTLQSMVRAGMGWAVMPRLAVDIHDPDIEVAPLGCEFAPRSIGMVRDPNRTHAPAVDRLIELAHVAFADLR